MFLIKLKMIKKCVLVLFFVVNFLKINGQNSMQFTNYIFNSFYLNPGAAGILNKTVVQANVRSQYTSYSGTFDAGGSVINNVFSADLPLSKISGGLGIYFSSSNTSKVQNSQEIHVSYSYHKKINNNVLGLGISGGLNNQKYFGENYRPRDENDPLIPNSNLNVSSPDLNIGAFLFNPNYQLGLSIRNILEPKYKFNDVTSSPVEKRKYILSGKIDFGVSYTLDLSPMFIIKSDLNTISTELGVLANYNQKYWGGINYRWQDAASILIGGNFLKNNIKVGYALDIVNFGVLAKSPTSHEIFLRYILNPPRIGKKSIIKTPRYNI